MTLIVFLGSDKGPSIPTLLAETRTFILGFSFQTAFWGTSQAGVPVWFVAYFGLTFYLVLESLGITVKKEK